MPFLIALWAGFVAILPQLAIRAAVALGVGAVSYVGFGALVDVALDQVQTNLAALPEQAIQLMSVMQIDKCITVIFSAFTIKLTMMGLTAGGALKKIYWSGTNPIVLN